MVTALYLVAAASKRISSVKLAEHLGIGQKTAWFLGQRIRRIMQDKYGLLRGMSRWTRPISAARGARKGSRPSATPTTTNRPGAPAPARAWSRFRPSAAGALVPPRDALTQSAPSPPLCWQSRHRADGARLRRASRLLLDRAQVSCSPAGQSLAGEYVRRDPHAAATAHTNTAEAFNATLKRALIGVWHRFSIKHTDPLPA